MTSDIGYDRLIGAVVGNYKIERLLATDEFGPVYGASDEDGGAYRLRVLPVRPPAGQAADTYLARFQQQAEHLALLRHPQILPLLDFGIYSGSPFLVWPHQPLRSLSGLIDENGPLDPVTTGRYLSQIADALEYAHHHDTLHRNLSTDCVYLHLNGQLVVADFGVRRIYELTGSPTQVAELPGASDACAPEQVVGGRVYLYTDVYAMGALAFRLLAGSPIFTGRVREDIAQQHVYSQVPSLRARRPGLPAGLEAVLARSLAKNSDQRYQHPSALARAYIDVLALANGAPDRADAGSLPQAAAGFESFDAPRVAVRSLSRNGSAKLSGAGSTSNRSSAKFFGRIVASFVILLALVGGGVFILHGTSGPAGPVQPGATVTFLDANANQPGETDGATDSAKIVAQGLSAPASGSSYYAWLINTASEEIIPLGVLVHSGNSYSVTFAPQASSSIGSPNLLDKGDKVEITLEQGKVTVPLGRVVLSGSFPPQTFTHIKHLLVSFPTTPNSTGLLVGALLETQRLNVIAHTLQAGMTSHDKTTVMCAAQSILDILEGQYGSDYRALDASCAATKVTDTGDKYALVGAKAANYTASEEDESYLDGASAHAALAGSQPDSNSYIKLRVHDAVTAMTNATAALANVRTDALALLSDPTNSAKASDLVTQADHAYNGSGNGSATANGLPNPFTGGVHVAYEEAQLMATLTLS